jgi:hypothetical protein
MIVLTLANYATDQIPIHLQITVFSLAIIIAGSFRSLRELISQIKKVHIDGDSSSSVETVTNKDALQFPIFAGGMLVGLYALIKFFGRESVNYILLAYIAVGNTTGIKALL